TVPVVIDVREAKFRSVRAGGGLGAEFGRTGRTEVRLLGEYTDRNFLGGLRRLTVSGRVGYAWIPSLVTQLIPPKEMEVTVPRRNDFIYGLNATLEQPRILFRDVSGQLQVGTDRFIEQAFSAFRGGGRVGFSWQPSAPFTLVGSFNLDSYRIDAGTTRGTEVGASFVCPETPLCTVLLSYFEQVLEWDRRDDRIRPRRGYYLGLSLQEGFARLSFDRPSPDPGGASVPVTQRGTYLRVVPEVRLYRSFGDTSRLTLATRVRAGTLVPLGLVGEGRLEFAPIVTRFFSGGPTTMRGFNSQQLSPRERQVVDGVQTEVPVGGSGLFEASLEARYNVFGPVVLATFLDTGLVTARPFGRVECDRETAPECTHSPVNLPAYISRNLQAATGVGLRYLTPVGPIRLDVAYRFLTQDLPIVVNGVVDPSLRIEDPRFVFHISIGEAF
ncbi:MAG: BamA/TamA family outer membrane protein, partial [Myxococcaceae bacterium]|nr:BamA/TamA family outer membrane protein [Myxococcaceae bacterium]